MCYDLPFGHYFRFKIQDSKTNINRLPLECFLTIIRYVTKVQDKTVQKVPEEERKKGKGKNDGSSVQDDERKIPCTFYLLIMKYLTLMI